MISRKNAWVLINYSLLFVALLFSVATSLQAQQENDPGVVEGFVVNRVTRAPVPDAQVALHCQMLTDAKGCSPVTSVVTGKDGRFRCTSVAPGMYLLIPSAPKFLIPQGSVIVSTTVKRTAGIRGLEIEISPESRISGRVVDANGEPASRVEVVALQDGGGPRTVNPKVLQEAARVSTSAEGTFDIGGLQEGKYFVAARVKGKAAGGTQNSRADAPPVYRVYHPSVPDVERAAALHLTAGQEIGGVTIQLRPMLSASIRGSVRPFPKAELPHPAAAGQVVLEVISSSLDAPLTPACGAAGEFAIDGLLPGIYTFRLFRYQPLPGSNARTKRLLGQQTVNLGEAGISDLIIEAQTPSLNVKVRYGDDLPANSRTAAWMLTLVPTREQIGLSPPIQIEIKGDEILATELSPIQYEVRASLAKDLFVRTVTFNGMDVLWAPLDLTSGFGGTLDIALGSGTGKLAGTLAPTGSELRDVRVVLIPAAVSFEEVRFVPPLAVAPVNQGEFQLDDIRPGVYEAVAVRSFASGLWADPAFVASLRGKGEKVTIQSKSSTRVTLSSSIDAEGLTRIVKAK